MFSTSVMLSGTGWWAWPDEAGHRRGVADGRPRLVGEVHADQHVAGQDGPLDHLALAVLDLRDLLGGDHDLVDVVLHVEGDDAVLEVGADAVLHAVVGVDDVPLARLGPQLAAELLERVLARRSRRPRRPPRRRRPRRRRRRRRPRRRRPRRRLVLDRVLDGLVGDRPRRLSAASSTSTRTSSTSLGRHRLVDGVDRLGRRVSSAVGSCSMSDCDTSTPYLSSGDLRGSW